MILIREAALKENDDWVDSSKQDLVATLNKCGSRKMHLYLVGHDYLIRDASLLSKGTSGTVLLSNPEGQIAGFVISSIRSVSKKTKVRFQNIEFSFHVGRKEYALTIF